MTADIIAQKNLHFFSSAEAAKAWGAQAAIALPRMRQAAAQMRHAKHRLDTLKAYEADLVKRIAYVKEVYKDSESKYTKAMSPDIEDLATLMAAQPARIKLRDDLQARIALAQKEYDAERAHFHDAAESYEKPIPVTTSFEIPSKVFKEEERVEPTKDGVLIAGTEFLGSFSTPAITVGGGGSLFTWPLSPAVFGGSRLQAFSQMYDMFRIVAMHFEYIPICPSSTAGALVGYTLSDIMDDPSSTRGGDVVTRDAVSREGAETNQVFKPTVYGVSLPQQALYYTTNQEVPNLMFAGLFNLLEVNPIAVNTTIGLINCHYEIEFLNASSIRFAGTTSRTIIDSSPSFVGLTETINQAFFVTTAQWATPALIPGEIGEGVMTAANDGANGTTWRSLRTGDDRATVNLGQGIRLWFRLDSAGTNILFYPSLGAAIVGHDAATDPGTPSDAYINSATTTLAGTASITITGVRIWMVPGSTI